MSQPLIKFVSQNHSDDSVDSQREYKKEQSLGTQSKHNYDMP